jgi:hypothetical protein
MGPGQGGGAQGCVVISGFFCMMAMIGMVDNRHAAGLTQVEHLLRQLSYQQWTPKEIASGVAWDALKGQWDTLLEM